MNPESSTGTISDLRSFTDSVGHTLLPRAVDSLLSIHYTSVLRLVSIADGKANMILNANSIVLSIIFAVLSRRPADQFWVLLLPLGILTVVCLVTSIYAILAARPKILHVAGDRHPLMSRVAFSEMSFTDFQKGMTELVASDQAVYDSLQQGLYANGQVLQKKLRYLSVSYRIFLWGLSASVVAYLGVLAFY